MNGSLTFDDLLNIRLGENELFLSGGGKSVVAALDTIDVWRDKSAALKELFLQTLGVTPENIDTPLKPELVSEERCDSYIRRKVTYNVEVDERIDAYLLLPENPISKKAPAVLCLTPTTSIGKEQTIGNGNDEGDADRSYALHLVKQGFATLTFDWDAAGK